MLGCPDLLFLLGVFAYLGFFGPIRQSILTLVHVSIYYYRISRFMYSLVFMSLFLGLLQKKSVFNPTIW